MTSYVETVDRLHNEDWMDGETEVIEVETILMPRNEFNQYLLDNNVATMNERGRLSKLTPEIKSLIRQKWLEFDLIDYDPEGNPIHPIQKYPICGAIDRDGYPCFSYSGNGTDKKGVPGVKCKSHGGASTGCTTIEGRLKQVASTITNGHSSRYLQAIINDRFYNDIASKIIEDFQEDPYTASDGIVIGSLIQALKDYDQAVKSGKNVDASRKADAIIKYLTALQTTPKERGETPQPIQDIAEIEETVSRRITILEEKKTRTFKKGED